MIEVRVFFPCEDNSEVCDFNKLTSLLKKRNLPEVNRKDIPQLGFVVEENTQAIAMGFLRQCEGNVGIMDSVITDPEASPAKRNDALDLIFSSVIEASKNLGIKRVLGFTTDEVMFERSKRFDFVEQDKKTVSLLIGA